MDSITLLLDPGSTGRDFDAHLDRCRLSGVKECGDLKVITKDKGMISGRACVGLFFTVRLPDGSFVPVQYTTSVRLLQMSLAALRGRYPEEQ